MSRKQVITILVVMAISLIIISLYTTFAYNEENSQLEDSNADYNLIYSLKDTTNQTMYVNSKDTKYVDIMLNNPYDATVKYGMYYRLISPQKLPDGVTISLSEDSVNELQDIIASHQSKTISLKIINNSDYSVNLVVGALVGFEKGNLEDLIDNNEILIQ